MKSIYLIAVLLFVFNSIHAQEPEPPALQKYFTDTVLVNIFIIGNERSGLWKKAFEIGEE